MDGATACLGGRPATQLSDNLGLWDFNVSKLVILFACGLTAALGFWTIAHFTAQPQPGDARLPTTVSLHGSTMGSSYSVRYLADAQASSSPAEVQTAIDEVLEEIDAQISTWNPESELSQFNASRSTDWLNLNAATVALIDETLELSQLSQGKFDITVAPLVDLWGFGPAGRPRLRPEQPQIDAALAHVGISALELRAEPPAARKSDPELRIDLSAVGAGAAADRISSRLHQLQIDNHYLNIAGEIVTAGRSADGRPWRIGVERPESGGREIIGTLQIAADKAAIATSGNYRNHFQIDGHQIVHTLDATTGQPVTSNVLSATVIDQRCSRADGLATMLMTMPADEGLALAEARGWIVLLVVPSHDGISLRPSSGWVASGMFSAKQLVR